MLKFLETRIWSHLPRTVSPRTRVLAAVLWSAVLVVYGVLVAHHRAKLGVPAGAAPYVAVTLGLIVGMITLIPGLGDRFYLGVLKFFAIPGFIISIAILLMGFYLVVTPMGLVLRLAGKDLLRTGKNSPPTWVPHTGNTTRSRYYRLS